MRRNLYHKNINLFIMVLKKLGWQEVTLNHRLSEREFRKGLLHLILRTRKEGPYCVIHKDRYRLGHHARPICKSSELIEVFQSIMKEYYRKRSVPQHTSSTTAKYKLTIQ